MDYKQIRAYQFKADSAVRALEAAGAKWETSQGKPHWAMPIIPTVDVEAIKAEQKKAFADHANEVMLTALRSLTGEPEGETEEKRADGFEMGPQHFPNRSAYVGSIMTINRIPSWHNLAEMGHRLCGSRHRTVAIEYLSKTHYRGYAVVFVYAAKKMWIPLNCISFKAK